MDTMTRVNKARNDRRHQNNGYVPGATFSLFSESSNKTKVVYNLKYIFVECDIIVSNPNTL